MVALLPPLFRDWRAALLLVAAALLSPGRAEARCGHPGSVFKSDLIAAEPSAKPAQVTQSQHQPVEAPVPAVPCNGPNCSEAPDRHSPPPSTASTVEAGAKEATQVLGALEPPDDGAPHICALTSSQPIRFASAIFHPPRVG